LDFYAAYGKSKASKRKIADIKIGVNKIFGGSKNHRYFCLTLFPSQFCSGDFQAFKNFLSSELTSFNYSKLFATGLVNYVELASDSYSHAAHSFLPYRKYCKKSNVHVDASGLGTTYLGSPKSGSYFRLYDKNKQLKDCGKPIVTKFPICTRIEAALRRVGVPVASLHTIKNPFLKLSIASLELAKAMPIGASWTDFVADCETIGTVEALAKRPEDRQKYLAYLDSIPVKWWNPAFVWLGIERAMERIAP
jgi:hypothetical protein